MVAGGGGGARSLPAAREATSRPTSRSSAAATRGCGPRGSPSSSTPAPRWCCSSATSAAAARAGATAASSTRCGSACRRCGRGSGTAQALALARASTRSVGGRWRLLRASRTWTLGFAPVDTCRCPPPSSTTTPAGVVAACRELGEPDACGPLDALRWSRALPLAALSRRRLYPGAATVQPARLAARAARPPRPAPACGCSSAPPVRRADGCPAGVELDTGGGTVRAGAAVLAAGPWLAGMRPLRRRLTLTSSHMVITEPVPDLLEEIGWTGGECITDSRAMVHYFRTTPRRPDRLRLGRGARRSGGPPRRSRRHRPRRGRARSASTC